MQVQQVIVASPRSATIKHNELISRSAGVNDTQAETICRLSPGTNELAFGKSESINCFSVDESSIAISRTLVGSREGSQGARRIFNHAILFQTNQLQGYEQNTALLAHVLLTQGAMTLPTEFNEEMPVLELAGEALNSLAIPFCHGSGEEFERLAHALKCQPRVVIMGLLKPLRFLSGFLLALPAEVRTRLSFATGLKVLDERPYSLQFMPETDPDLVNEFALRQIRTMVLKQKLATA